MPAENQLATALSSRFTGYRDTLLALPRKKGLRPTLTLDRYAAYASRSGVDDETIANARTGVGALQSMVPAARNEHLLAEAGFTGTELFYLGMAWRGWIAYAQLTPADISA